MSDQNPKRYRIEIEPKPGIVAEQAIRSLRALLKTLGRAYHLRVVKIEPVVSDTDKPSE